MSTEPNLTPDGLASREAHEKAALASVADVRRVVREELRESVLRDAQGTLDLGQVSANLRLVDSQSFDGISKFTDRFIGLPDQGRGLGISGRVYGFSVHVLLPLLSGVIVASVSHRVMSRHSKSEKVPA